VSYAGDMRYSDGGGLDAAERARRERVRLAAAEMSRSGQTSNGRWPISSSTTSAS
jgi:hypothetical protein